MLSRSSNDWANDRSEYLSNTIRLFGKFWHTTVSGDKHFFPKLNLRIGSTLDFEPPVHTQTDVYEC